MPDLFTITTLTLFECFKSEIATATPGIGFTFFGVLIPVIAQDSRVAWALFGRHVAAWIIGFALAAVILFAGGYSGEY